MCSLTSRRLLGQVADSLCHDPQQSRSCLSEVQPSLDLELIACNPVKVRLYQSEMVKTTHLDQRLLCRRVLPHLLTHQLPSHCALVLLVN